MKKYAVLIALVLSTSSAFAGICQKKAVQVAKRAAYNSTKVLDVEQLATEKPYLVAYRVTLGLNSDSELYKNETIKVTLMTSDCTEVSVIHD